MSSRVKFSSNPLSKTVHLSCAYDEKIGVFFFSPYVFQEAVSILSAQ